MRAEIEIFANLMNDRMDLRHKKYGGDTWKKDSLQGLMNHLKDEIEELQDALDSDATDNIIEESVDVANMAMMIADVAGGLSTNIEKRKCEICNKNDAAGIASSKLCPISHAYCSECISANREVWTTLVGGLSLIGGLFGCNKDFVSEWIRPIIKATCEFYGKTEGELWAEVDRLEKDYESMLKSKL